MIDSMVFFSVAENSAASTVEPWAGRERLAAAELGAALDALVSPVDEVMDEQPAAASTSASAPAAIRVVSMKSPQ
ncbi:MAG: hypothetical protein Q4G45_07250 [Actinomycetia bacterium]|nr:hypothetical protein [Actinomycetes bacterium]